MKKIILTLIAAVMMTLNISAMTYTQAREQALFLTDKMAYELNLTPQQYEAAYEINLDYLMSLNSVDDFPGLFILLADIDSDLDSVGDVYAASWRQRNLDLQYILYDWQYTAYCAASYFFRPVYWNAGYWHFGIYAHYPHRNHFYFSRPAAYAAYRGAHSWRHNGGRSWYVNQRNHYRPEVHRQHYVGMRGNYTERHQTPKVEQHRSSTRETVTGNRYNHDRSYGNNSRYGNNNRFENRNNDSRYGNRSNNNNTHVGTSRTGTSNVGAPQTGTSHIGTPRTGNNHIGNSHVGSSHVGNSMHSRGAVTRSGAGATGGSRGRR